MVEFQRQQINTRSLAAFTQFRATSQKKKKKVKFMLAVTIMDAFYFYRKTGFSSRKRINLKGPFHWKFDEIHSLFGGN